MVTVRGQELDVDVRAELEEFTWIRPSWNGVKLIAASPFRYDGTPSFSVNLEHGGWTDMGASDSEYASGNLVKLLAFMRDETYGETAEYLTSKYGASAENIDGITLKLPQLSVASPRITSIGKDLLDSYKYRHAYLAGRGISETVQRVMSIGYDRQRHAVTFPWFNPDGTLGNVKYRRTDAKTFWYAKGGRPIREMVYGIHVAYKRRIQRAAIVEAEVDALTLMSAGVYAIATGGSAFTAAKRDLILRSPIEELTLFRDNDVAGKAWRNHIVEELRPRMNLRVAYVPSAFKDVNEWAVRYGMEPLKPIYDTARSCRMLTFNIH